MQLFLADNQGKTLARLSQFDNANLASPKWSQDDKTIALQVNQQGENYIALVDVDPVDTGAKPQAGNQGQ